jgi:hypothetical protein
VGLTFLPGTTRDGFATVIHGKAWRFDGGAAITRMSSGWPCTPGLVTPENISNVRGFLDGAEVPIAVSPLRGKHPDGSFRAIGVQCRGVASFVQRAFRIEVWSTPRSGANTLPWIEPTYDVPVGEDATDWPAMTQQTAIAPSDPVYLCATNVAFQTLQPQSLDVGLAASNFGVGNGSEWDVWVATLPFPAITVSTYEFIHGFYTAYLRSGSRAMYERAQKELVNQLVFKSNYTIGSDQVNTVGGSPFANVYGPDPTLPPGPPGNSGLYSEQHSQITMSWATGYLMTAWKHPWRHICHKLSWQAGSLLSDLSATWGIRFNLGIGDFQILQAAYVVEATMQVPSPPSGYGAGRDPNVMTFAAQLPNLLTVLRNRVYTAAYAIPELAGLLGQRQDATASSDNGQVGSHTFSQAMITSRFLIFYYNNIAPDAAIPAEVRKQADITIAFATVNGNEAYWRFESDINDPFTAGNTDPWWSGFYSEMFGFAYATETDPVKKQTYFEFLERAMNRAQYNDFIKNGKALGEYFGAQQSAAFYHAGGQPRSLVGAHPTVITEPPIWTS